MNSVFFSIISFSLFLFPIVFFIMLLFIYLHNKIKNKITVYEALYGVLFTKQVMEDMKGIPPEDYNYNPQSFVPEIHGVKNEINKEKTSSVSFEDELKAQEDFDGGNAE